MGGRDAMVEWVVCEKTRVGDDYEALLAESA